VKSVMNCLHPRGPTTPDGGTSPNLSPSTKELMKQMQAESAELQAAFLSKMSSISPQASPGDSDVGVGIMLGFWGDG